MSVSNETVNNEEVNVCELCKPYGLEKGDSLYQRFYPDLDFHEIFNIQFCPLCGKELKEDNI